MADGARQSHNDLADALGPSEAFDFFELLRRLEREGNRFGHAGGPDREPARLGQHIRLAFATQDVAELRRGADNKPSRVTVANIGLLGPEGPLPIHMTRWVLDRLSQRWFSGGDERETADTTFVDFANILQHRMIALYYRAWADAHPEVQVERAAGGRVRAMLQSLAGIGLPGTRPDGPDGEVVRLRQAAALASQVEGPERLTLYLEEAFRVPVRLKEYVAAWITVPKPLQTQLARAYAGLGKGAAIGPRTFDRQSRIELTVGPLSLADYRSLMPGTPRLAAFKNAVRELVGGVLDVDVRLVLAKAEIPRAKLGEAQLGRASWLPRAANQDHADEMLMRTAVGWRGEGAAA